MFPKEIYNFSCSSTSTYLRKQGYLRGEREQAPADEIPEFILCSGEKQFTSRTLGIQTNILARIVKLHDEALAKYGY